MARVPAEEAERMGQIFPHVMKGNRGLPKTLYEKTVNMPFEVMEIPVLAGYGEVLASRYYDYFKVRKVWNGHDYPYFEKQRTMLLEMADFELPEFKYNPKLDVRNSRISNRTLSENANETTDNLRSTAKRCILEFDNMIEDIRIFLEQKKYEEVMAAVLPDCQQLAVDLGTLVENIKGESNNCTIKVTEALQEFCDVLYALYQELPENRDESELNSLFDDIKASCEALYLTIEAEIINKDTIVFVTIGAEEWNTFAPIYEEKIKENADVYVVCLPVLSKNPYGEMRGSQEELAEAVHIEKYSDELCLIKDWNEFDFEFLWPDEIYIQNPYDGENPYLTVPPRYYSLNLKKYTDKLIYVPPFFVEEFGTADTTTIYNMKHYVTAPGVMYADCIIAQSENMRNLYIEKFVEFAGENTRSTWESKVIVNHWRCCSEKAVKERPEGFKSRMLFCIGINEIISENANFINKIKGKLDIIKENCKNILVDVCLYPPNVNEWKKIDDKLTEELLSELKAYEAADVIRVFKGAVRPLVVRDYEAYYGSPSPLVHWFNYEGKPVMVMAFFDS